MERKITIILEDGSRDTVTFTSNATTLLELKNELVNQGIDYSGKLFYEGISRTELKTDESILPSNLPYRGTITNDLVFMLTKPNKRINSGASRAELYAFIKEHNLGGTVKEIYGSNYTNVKTSCLEDFVDSYNKKGCPEDFVDPDDVKEEDVKVEDVKAENPKPTYETLVDTLNTIADILNDVVTLTRALGVQLGFIEAPKPEEDTLGEDDFMHLFEGWIK